MNSAFASTYPIVSSYWEFLWKASANRKELLFASVASTTCFILFKLLYPYPDFFSDSYSYIFAASEHLNVSIWPIGYSWFLAIVHAFTSNDTVLVAIQYFSVQAAATHFYFSLIYFFCPNKPERKALLVFIALNPLSLYISNTINSDVLFGALSLLWITELIWIIRNPRPLQVLIQAGLLVACFSIRNNAYYYPLLAILAFLISNQHKVNKILGIALSIAVITSFVLFTRNEAYKLTGTRQFSLFTGWQLANNALYIYDQVKIDSSELPTTGARELNRYAKIYFSHVKEPAYRKYLDSYVGNFFIREPNAPLKYYYWRHYKVNNERGSIVAWAKASETFESFGKPILLNHPTAYLRYFVVPNLWNYLIPPLSHLKHYNYGQDIIDPIAQSWFNYPQPKVHVFSHDFQGNLLMVYQGLFLCINLYFSWQIFLLLRRRKSVQLKTASGRIYIVLIAFLALNLAFSLVSTEDILRYQFIPMFILVAFTLLFDSFLARSGDRHKTTSEVYTSTEAVLSKKSISI